MLEKDIKRLGKHLALILRHKPELAGVSLDSEGFAPVKPILSYLKIDRDTLDEIVDSDNKGRFSYDTSGELIRANQGHSVDINITYKKHEELDYLFHGTSSKFLESIRKSGGLRPQSRTHIHLSKDMATAVVVGRRHAIGTANVVLLGIDAEAMRKDGLELYESENGVVLADSVDWKYIEVLEYKD